MPPMEVIGRLRGPLRMSCHLCGHEAVWTPDEARRKLGGDCTVPRARRKLRCSACGARRVNFAVGPARR